MPDALDSLARLSREAVPELDPPIIPIPGDPHATALRLAAGHASHKPLYVAVPVNDTDQMLRTPPAVPKVLQPRRNGVQRAISPAAEPLAENYQSETLPPEFEQYKEATKPPSHGVTKGGNGAGKPLAVPTARATLPAEFSQYTKGNGKLGAVPAIAAPKPAAMVPLPPADIHRRVAESAAELEARSSTEWSAAKDDAERLHILNRSRQPFGLPEAFEIPAARGAGTVAAEQFGTVRGAVRKLPVVGAAVEAVDLWDVYAASKAAEKGTADADDWETLAKFQEDLVERARGTTLAGGAVNIASEAIPFGLEFALTGGLGALIRGGIRKVGRETVSGAIKRAAVQAMRGQVGEAAAGLGGAVVRAGGRAAVRTAGQTATVSLPRAASYTVRAMLPDSTLTVDDEGALAQVIHKPGADFWSAARDELADTAIEIYSESTGRALGTIGGLAARAAGKAAPAVIRVPASKVGDFVTRARAGTAAALAATVGDRTVKAGAEFLEKAGFAGVIEEMGEERVGQVLRLAASQATRAAGGDSSLDPGAFWAPKQWLQEAVGFALTGAALATGGAVASLATKPRSHEAKEVGSGPEIGDPGTAPARPAGVSPAPIKSTPGTGAAPQPLPPAPIVAGRGPRPVPQDAERVGEPVTAPTQPAGVAEPFPPDKGESRGPTGYEIRKTSDQRFPSGWLDVVDTHGAVVDTVPDREFADRMVAELLGAGGRAEASRSADATESARDAAHVALGDRPPADFLETPGPTVERDRGRERAAEIAGPRLGQVPPGGVVEPGPAGELPRLKSTRYAPQVARTGEHIPGYQASQFRNGISVLRFFTRAPKAVETRLKQLGAWWNPKIRGWQARGYTHEQLAAAVRGESIPKAATITQPGADITLSTGGLTALTPDRAKHVLSQKTAKDTVTQALIARGYKYATPTGEDPMLIHPDGEKAYRLGRQHMTVEVRNPAKRHRFEPQARQGTLTYQRFSDSIRGQIGKAFPPGAEATKPQSHEATKEAAGAADAALRERDRARAAPPVRKGIRNVEIGEGRAVEFTRENVKAAFGLKDSEAEAVVALAEAMGLDLSKVQVARGGKPGEAALLQEGKPDSLGFYSQMRRVVEQLPHDNSPVTLAYLKKNGVKDDELFWTEIGPFIEARGGSAKKSDVLGNLESTAVDVEERVLPSAIMQDRLVWRDVTPAMEESILARWAIRKETIGGRVVRVATTGDNGEAWIVEQPSPAGGWPRLYVPWIEREEGRPQSSLEMAEVYARERAVLARPGGSPKYENWTEPGGDNYREILLRLPGVDPPYKSGHFSSPINIVVHARVKDRTDDQGRKVLFIEEIQSDWHQAGRKQGYAKPRDEAAVRRLTEEGERIGREHLRLIQERDRTIAAISRIRPETLVWRPTVGEQRILERWEKTRAHIATGSIVATADFTAVPDAMWIVRNAGQEGYDERGNNYSLYIFGEHVENFETSDEAKEYANNMRPPPHPRTGTSERTLRQEVSRWAGNQRLLGQGNAYKHPLAEHFLTVNAEYEESLRITRDFDQELMAARGKGAGVPAAPFAKNWHDLAMKRLTRMAAQGGYDAVAWTTGAQQNARYDLSKHVSSLRWNMEGGTVGTLEGFDTNGDVAIDRRMRPEQLPEYIGEELAARLLAAPRRSSPDEGLPPLTIQELRGVELEIGGEGMKGFYDRMLVSDTNKLIKRFGGRVEPIKIRIGRMADELRSRERETQNYLERLVRDTPLSPERVHQIEALAGGVEGIRDELLGERETLYFHAYTRLVNLQDEIEKEGGKREPKAQPGFVITPEMRASVLATGFPLFQGPKGAVEFTTEGKAIIRGLKAADVSTGVHELAHVARRQLFNLAVPPENRAGVTDDEIQSVQLWAGAKGGEWTREAEEKFARGFERYMREGKAPTAGLKSLFAKIARFLRKIYRHLRDSDIDIEISPGIRRIFGKAFAEVRAEAARTATEPRSQGAREPKPRAPPTAREQLATYKKHQRIGPGEHAARMARDQRYAELVTASRAEQARKNFKPDKAKAEDIEVQRKAALIDSQAGTYRLQTIRYVPVSAMPRALRTAMQDQARMLLARTGNQRPAEEVGKALRRIVEGLGTDKGYEVEQQKERIAMQLLGELDDRTPQERSLDVPRRPASQVATVLLEPDRGRRREIVLQAAKDLRSGDQNDLVNEGRFVYLAPKRDEPFPHEPSDDEIEQWLWALVEAQPGSPRDSALISATTPQSHKATKGETKAEAPAGLAETAGVRRGTIGFDPETLDHARELSRVLGAAEHWDAVVRGYGLDGPEATEAAEEFKERAFRFAEVLGLPENMGIRKPGSAEFVTQIQTLQRLRDEIARREVAKLREEGKLKDMPVAAPAIGTTTPEDDAYLAELRKTAPERPAFGMGAKANIPDTQRMAQRVGNRIVKAFQTKEKSSIRTSIGRAAFAYWGVPESIWRPAERVKGGKRTAQLRGEGFQRKQETGLAKLMNEAKAKNKGNPLSREQINKIQKDYGRQLISAIEGRTSPDKLDPDQRAAYDRYVPLIRHETDWILQNEWSWPWLKAFGFDSIIEVIAVKRMGPGAYLRKLYEPIPGARERRTRYERRGGELHGFASESRRLLSGLRGGPMLPRRGDEDNYVVVNAIDPKRPQYESYLSREEAQAVANEWIRANLKQHGEQARKRIKVLNPFSTEELTGQGWTNQHGDVPVLEEGTRDPLEIFGVLRRIEDAALLMTQTLADSAHNRTTLILYKTVADTQALAQRPDGAEGDNYVYVPNAPEWGPIAGQWIPESTWYYLTETERVATGFWSQAWQLWSYAWKSSKVVWDPAAICRNLQGGIAFQFLDDMNFVKDSKWISRAAKEFFTRGETFWKLVAENELDTGWNRSSLGALEEMLEKDPAHFPLVVLRFVEKHPKMLTEIKRQAGAATAANRVVGGLYDAPDQILKLASYLKKTEAKGFTHDEALRQMWMYPNYARPGRAARRLRRSILGDPFVMFSEQTAKIYLRGLRDRPARMLALAAIPGVLGLIGRLLWGVDDDEMEVVNSDRRRQTWADRYFKPVVWRGADGKIDTWNLKYIFPLASELSIWDEKGGLKIPFVMSNPWIVAANELAFNRDDFTGRQIWSEDDGDLVRLWKIFKHAGLAVAPLPTDLLKPGRSAPVQLFKAAVGESEEGFARAVGREVFGVRIDDPWADRARVFDAIKAARGQEDVERYQNIMRLWNDVYKRDDAIESINAKRIRPSDVRESVKRDRRKEAKEQ